MAKIDELNTGINWLEHLLKLSKKYKIKDWLETFLVIIITGLILIALTHPKEIIEYFEKAYQKEHIELIEQRRDSSKEVNSLITKALYKLEAKRVVVMELHNGNSTLKKGVPFLKASATFEAISDDSYPVAEMYQNCNLSLTPFANYLYTNNYWEGYVNDLKEIDKSLCYRMLSNETEYCSAVAIPGVEGTIGYLFLSYDLAHPAPTDVDLETIMKKLAMKIGLMLELRK